jgi:threonine/homoserine/homoserine lactone efflux protein
LDCRTPCLVGKNFLLFLLFMFVGSITPGPNTMISMASGAAFGFARTLPRILGVSIGFPLMIAGLGFGLGDIFRQQPWLHKVLRIAGSAFLLYLACPIAVASGPQRAEAKRPPTFIEAALFRWLNPKTWTLALGTIAAFTRPGLSFGDYLVEIALIALRRRARGRPQATCFSTVACRASGSEYHLSVRLTQICD